MESEGSSRWGSWGLGLLGWGLLITGAAVGWGLPVLHTTIGWPDLELLSTAHIDTSTFQGAELTSLSVLIAVVIGFNVTLLQLASQAHSLRVSRDILRGLLPFLISWTIVSTVILLDFLFAPQYVVQIWQDILWFLAVTTLMVEYLWSFPRRLTGDYVAAQALRDLKKVPIADWESRNGHGVLQSMMAGAIQRGDLATTRTLMTLIGEFLATWTDRAADAQPGYDRRRYRALRNLFIAAAQQAETAPNAAAYALGTAEAGYFLQSIANGHRADDRDHSLYASLLRTFDESAGRLVALVTGLRHALFRTQEGPALLLRYWAAHTRWEDDDPRLAREIAVLIANLFIAAERRLLAIPDDEVAQTKGAVLIDDLRRAFVEDLLPDAERMDNRSRWLATVFSATLEEVIARAREREVAATVTLPRRSGTSD